MTNPLPSKHPVSALHRLFARQQPRVRASQRKRDLLQVYADDNYKNIATLIQRWLDEGDKEISS